MRQQGGFGLDAEANHFLCGHHGDLGQLLGAGVIVDVGIEQKHLAARQQQAVHTGIGIHAFAFADDLVKVVKVVRGIAPGSANQAIDFALAKQHAGDQCQSAAHFDLGNLHRHATPFHQAVIGLPEVAIAVVLLDVDNVVVQPFLEPKAELFNALGNDGRPADQRRARERLVHDDLAGTQNALFFAFGIGDAFALGVFGGGKDRLHHRARRIDKTLQPFAVGVEIGDRSQRHAAIGRSLGHSGRDLDHQPRVERLGYQVFRAEGEFFADVGQRHDFTLLGLRQVGNRMYRCNFHLDCDGRSPGVECATKNVGKTQDVVDLIRKISTAGGDDGIVANGFHFVGRNLRIRVRQRKNDRPCSHFPNHVGLEHAAGRQAQKHVGPFNDFA